MKTIIKEGNTYGYIDGYCYHPSHGTTAIIVFPNLNSICITALGKLGDVKIVSIEEQKYYNDLFFN